MNISLLQ